MNFYKISSKLPSLDFLSIILENFSNIPYENISKIIKWNESFEQDNHFRLPDQVISDHIDLNLGGTCFSLTFSLQTILIQNRFFCYPVSADMLAGKNIHCALVVVLENKKYLVDPGYLLNRPKQIDPNNPRFYNTDQTGVELQFHKRQNRYHLSTFTQHEKKWRYSFRDLPVAPEKFLKYWQESFCRNSMHGICLTKVSREGLIYIHKNFMRKTNFAGKQNFNIRNNYHETIKSIFGIKQEVVEQALVALEENLKRERDLGLFSGVPK